MKKVLVIIRVCDRDDYIGYLCLLSFQKVMKADYLFFAEDGNYKWITQTDGRMFYRSGCDNFGGQLGLHCLINNCKLIDASKYDYIIVSDADITMLKNPLDYNFEFGGIQDKNNLRHFSGQLLIYSKDIWNKVLAYDKYNSLIDRFVKEGIDVADDTCMSYVATEYTYVTFDFSGLDYWRHEKNYHLEPKQDA